MALKAWDLLIFERCYGMPDYHKMIVGEHPPARDRIPDQTNYYLGGSFLLHWCYAPSGRTEISGLVSDGQRVERLARKQNAC